MMIYIGRYHGCSVRTQMNLRLCSQRLRSVVVSAIKYHSTTLAELTIGYPDESYFKKLIKKSNKKASLLSGE